MIEQRREDYYNKKQHAEERKKELDEIAEIERQEKLRAEREKQQYREQVAIFADLDSCKLLWYRYRLRNKMMRGCNTESIRLRRKLVRWTRRLQRPKKISSKRCKKGITLRSLNNMTKRRISGG